VKVASRVRDGRLVAQLAWLLLYVSVVVLLAFGLVARFREVMSPDPVEGTLLRPGGGSYGAALFALELVVIGWYVGNTLLMASRRRNDWVALYVSAGGMLFLAFALPELDVLTVADPRWTIPVVVAQWLGGAMPVLFQLFFPDGRFVPRWSVSLAVLWPLAWGLAAVLVPGPSGLLTMPAARSVLWITVVTAGLAAPLYRFRSASPIVRQQTKWIAAGNFSVFGALVVIVPARFVAAGELPAWLRATATLPLYVALLGGLGLAFTMGILKYRLWDIDVLIKRTLVYAVTTAAIAAAFFGGLVVLQAALRPLTSGSELAVAVSTLTSFALFQPLRGRVQAAVDRRFYRSHYDASRALDAFGDRMANEVDLGAVRASLLNAAGETMRPATASLWLREPRNVSRTAGP
jgi:hypothetical protein